ncbi:MAG TPA: hypothetical protein PKD24_08595 [Pyrinomonadaceae bacterium]|nr:hypothetical protein [Pyrinomonadaceae bacterium]HMP65873.1 hypothetical protein [Pyrinomonadaceae bacterium]
MGSPKAILGSPNGDLPVSTTKFPVPIDGIFDEDGTEWDADEPISIGRLDGQVSKISDRVNGPPG